MELKLEFVPSAFRHGLTKEDIRWVLSNYLADGTVEEGDETALVFHAMECRKKWLVKLGLEE